MVKQFTMNVFLWPVEIWMSQLRGGIMPEFGTTKAHMFRVASALLQTSALEIQQVVNESLKAGETVEQFRARWGATLAKALASEQKPLMKTNGGAILCDTQMMVIGPGFELGFADLPTSAADWGNGRSEVMLQECDRLLHDLGFQMDRQTLHARVLESEHTGHLNLRQCIVAQPLPTALAATQLFVDTGNNPVPAKTLEEGEPIVWGDEPQPPPRLPYRDNDSREPGILGTGL